MGLIKSALSAPMTMELLRRIRRFFWDHHFHSSCSKKVMLSFSQLGRMAK
jgi:hypothetical protein